MGPKHQIALAAATIAVCLALGTTWRPATAPAPPDPPIAVDNPSDHCLIAAIGDYGEASPSEASVAALVHSWQPDLVITLGDNNYPDGAASTIDANVGQFYRRYIAPYRGRFGAGASVNRFFPTLGNHDWRAAGAAPYLEYFDLPGNERYYQLRWGPVDLFAIDSDRHEPDGVTQDSVQARWLADALAQSEAPWKIVYMHHPPYSSGEHGGAAVLRWPFAEWGADAVLAGHDHLYERIERDGVVYVVNGLSGSPSHYDVQTIDTASRVRLTGVWGALQIEADPTTLTFRFATDAGQWMDVRTLTR